jgi:hypothetical protein
LKRTATSFKVRENLAFSSYWLKSIKFSGGTNILVIRNQASGGGCSLLTGCAAVGSIYSRDVSLVISNQAKAKQSLSLSNPIFKFLCVQEVQNILATDQKSLYFTPL